MTIDSRTPHDGPIQRFTRLLLFGARQAHASELIVSPTPSERSPIRYRVKGNWHDWWPPPAHMLPAIVAELGKLAAFTRRPFPKEGLIDLRFSGVRLLWVIRAASADADYILTPVDQ